MKGIEKITARVAAEAAAQVDAILAEAGAQADGIRAEYDTKAQAAYEAAMAAGKAEIAQDSQRVGNAARMECKKELLLLKQSLIDKTYQSAKEKIMGLPEGEYVAFLSVLAGNASVDGTEEVVLNEADSARVGAQVVAAANALVEKRGLPGKLTLSETTRPISGGLMLRKGDVDVNCALNSLVDMSRNSLDAEIAAVLFG